MKGLLLISLSALLEVAALAGWTGASVAATGEPTLKVGDPAPKLQTGNWLQGQPVNEFQKGKAYVIEFWATWCGPCRASIPHLNELHEKFKDNGLVVIGQDVWERDDASVAPFVKQMGDRMTYCAALDDRSGEKNGAMAANWMTAAGRNTIPTAFLVDTTGRVAWIGHPMELRTEWIEAVLAGKSDAQKVAAEYEQQRRDLARFNSLIAAEDYTNAYALAAQLSATDADNAMLQNDLAWRIATDPAISQRDLSLAETMATRANATADGKDANILDTLARVLYLRGKKAEAIGLEEKAVNLVEGDRKAVFQKVLDSYRRGEQPKLD